MRLVNGLVNTWTFGKCRKRATLRLIDKYVCKKHAFKYIVYRVLRIGEFLKYTHANCHDASDFYLTQNSILFLIFSQGFLEKEKFENSKFEGFKRLLNELK